MTISLETDPAEQSGDRIFLVCAEFGLGLFLSWSLVAASFHIEAIRSHYNGMTSFAALGLILTLLLAPVWLGMRMILWRYLPVRFRSPIAFFIPTLLTAFLSLEGILALNQMWMSGPDY